MKKILKRLIITILIFSLISAYAVTTSAVDVSELGSLLDSYVSANGYTFTLDTDSRLFVVSDNEPSEELLQTSQLIQRQIGTLSLFNDTAPEMVWGPENYAEKGDIILKLDSASAIDSDGYELNVSTSAMITASDTDGLIYGANTLIKCLNYGNSISGFVATDAPDTNQRVVMLDTGRKYYSSEWIKNFIRQISWMGYNTIEFHFSEDGGFRADFWDADFYKDANGDGTAYNPENDFTWLCGSHVQSWVKDPYREDPDAGKYLTTAEIVDILSVAKEYHIDVIPSFDSPAHMDYITWKFEQNYISNKSYSFIYNDTTYKASSTSGCINYTGKTGASTPSWPYYTTIDITDGTMAKAFVFALYEDIADFFKEYSDSTDFSIGADEVNLSADYSFKWSYSEFPDYINELNRMLNAKGYTCRMFNDFIGSTTYNMSSSETSVYSFDENIEIMYWNSDFNPTSGKWSDSVWHVMFFWENNTGDTNNWGDGGRIIYNCIQTNCYYVLRVAASTTSYPNMDARNPENHNWAFYDSNEEDIYNTWYPADISEKGVYTENAVDVPAEQLGGAYFLIWNDYASLNTEEEVWNDVPDNTGTSDYTYSLFDRMWSNSIKMWNSDINSTVEFSDFAIIRDTFGFFPGYTSCSQAAELPSATAPSQAYLADHSKLEAAIAEKITNDDCFYTADSYAEYEAVYNAAVEINKNYAATQQEIDSALETLSAAQSELVENISDTAEILSIRKINEITPLGKKVGMVIMTSTDAKSLTLSLDGTPVELTLKRNNVQVLSDEDVRVWMIDFPADETGTFEYTITVNGSVKESISVTIR